jgi:iron complex outermembrane receptor protein
MLDRRVQLNVAGFWNEMSNQQILRLLSPTVTFVDNAGHTRAKGFDATLSVLPVKNFRIDGAMTVQKARFTKYLSGTLDFSGNHQLRSPDFMASLSAEYTVPLGNGEIALRGDVFHQSKVFFDGANLSLPGGFQPGYTLANAQIAFRPGAGNLEVALWAKNLTSEKYYRNIAIQGTAGIGVPGEPLTAGMSLSWKLR